MKNKYVSEERVHMRKENSVFRTEFITESGCCIKNQDYFDFMELDDYCCYCIADGNEEDLKHENTKLAVNSVITAFRENPGCSKKLVKYYMQVAHKTLYNSGGKEALETSMIILLTDYQKALWISRGSTKLFGIRNGIIKWTAKENYIGQFGTFEPVIEKKQKLRDGDIFILYTRGAWKNIENRQLLQAARQTDALEKLCDRLEEIVLDHRQDIIENYTIVSIFIDKTYKKYKKNGGTFRT